MLLTLHGEILPVATDVELGDGGGDVAHHGLHVLVAEVTPGHVQLGQPADQGEEKGSIKFRS